MIEFKNVTYTYPFHPEPAVEQISFDVPQGQAVLCTGSSGSGKSTLIRLINGLSPHYFKGIFEGSVKINGRETKALSVHEISKTVGTMFQDPEHQFFALNATDEMGFALECRGERPDRIAKILAKETRRFGLQKVMGNSIFDLSEGEKQKLALGSVLALNPRLLILDEPSANLDPVATRELAGHLAKLKAQGMTLFIADHRLYWLKGLIDRVLVLENGKIAEETGFDTLDDDAFRERYGLRAARVSPLNGRLPEIGRADGTFKVRDHKITVENLTFGYKNKPLIYDRASLSFPGSAAVAVTGGNGTGKTTLARMLTGLLPVKNAVIRKDGVSLTPKQLLKKGSIVLQNTDHQLHMKTVEKELYFSGEKFKGKTEDVQDLLEKFNLSRFSKRHPQSLSGGQKQRLVIAAALIKSPGVLILDEPTSGLDGVNMDIISNMIRELAASGILVLVITHDLELMAKACTHELALPLLKG